MNNENNHIEINRQSWNNRTEIHLEDKIAMIIQLLRKRKTTANS